MFEDEIKEYESIRNIILVFSEFTMQNISVFSEEMQKIILVFSYFYSKTIDFNRKKLISQGLWKRNTPSHDEE